MKSKLFLIAALALLVSCSKQGPIGLTGEQGPAGTNGTNGAVNMKILIDSVPIGAWTSITNGYSASFTESYITSADSDNITISVSTSGNVSSSWYALPYSNILVSGDQMEFNYYQNQVTIVYNYTSAPTQTLYFKIIVTRPSGIFRKNTGGNGQAQN